MDRDAATSLGSELASGFVVGMIILSAGIILSANCIMNGSRFGFPIKIEVTHVSESAE